MQSSEDGYYPVSNEEFAPDSLLEEWSGCVTTDSEGYLPRTIAPFCDNLHTKASDGCDYKYTTGYVKDQLNHYVCDICEQDGNWPEVEQTMEMIVYFECVEDCCTAEGDTEFAPMVNGCHILTHLPGDPDQCTWESASLWSLEGPYNGEEYSYITAFHGASPASPRITVGGVGRFICDGFLTSAFIWSFRYDYTSTACFPPTGDRVASNWAAVTCWWLNDPPTMFKVTKNGYVSWEPYPLDCDGT